LARGLGILIERIQQPAHKVLVLDCDQTLWGGVIGELGVSGIELGQDGVGSAFVAFQRVAKALAENGTILALSSKNEGADVWSVFKEHPSMVLHRDDIAAFRIDWREKAIHLKEIAADLGIGLDSLVFWDDNPLERESIRAELPMVAVPEPPVEVADWPAALMSLDTLSQFTSSADDLNKTQQYRVRAAFSAESRRVGNTESFLSGIGMTPKCVGVDAATLGRATQLCAKTNQFNLRLVRYDETALSNLLKRSGCIAFLVGLSDKFGDHGIIGLVIATRTRRPDVAFLDTFLLSCRVLGRHLDAWMLDALRSRLLAAGFQYLLAEFVPGARNAPAARFLHLHGFHSIDDPTVSMEHRAMAQESENIADHNGSYIVGLGGWQIPHLEIFTHDPKKTD